ncbi:hypothetical protein RIR_jg12119.t1 [Rhizophagus irregularis DAOM 181602=DAOM 197198]|uniref:Uncharacterized protein n=1 Tax=Rhizophagus irregularis (strain DAOM 197198w) TaxID=1432141 RepID=A0A015JKK8_RHIIW|nr:hypothetical protein RirG_224980 [Rhizophagus irregularis DAOM 197198w]GBC32728.1 hypothetical protein RIR_jg12119.t1 [Rhizophagus irregularis DAOM 181602=DAOM 197198]
MEPSVPLVKFVKNPLYQEFRYIEGKLIIRYDNPFQTQFRYIKISLMIRYIEVPVYRISLCIAQGPCTISLY